jgi:hypothetical protein
MYCSVINRQPKEWKVNSSRNAENLRGGVAGHLPPTVSMNMRSSERACCRKALTELDLRMWQQLKRIIPRGSRQSREFIGRVDIECIDMETVMLCGYLIICSLALSVGRYHSCRDCNGHIIAPRLQRALLACLPANLHGPVRVLSSCFVTWYSAFSLSSTHLLRLQPVQELGCEVRDDNVRASSQNALRALERHRLAIEHARLRRGANHRILATDLVRSHGHVLANLLRVRDDVQVLRSGLDHDDVRALADVAHDSAACETATAGRELVAAPVAERRRGAGGFSEWAVETAREFRGVRHE